jgi:hypothetical protein
MPVRVSVIPSRRCEMSFANAANEIRPSWLHRMAVEQRGRWTIRRIYQALTHRHDLRGACAARALAGRNASMTQTHMAQSFRRSSCDGSRTVQNGTAAKHRAALGIFRAPNGKAGPDRQSMVTITNNKGNAGCSRADGEWGGELLHRVNQARCACAGFRFVWYR